MLFRSLTRWTKSCFRSGSDKDEVSREIPEKKEEEDVRGQTADVDDTCVGLRRPLKQPEFHQDKHTLGTFLAYRMEEIGVKDYFVVPGDFNLTLLDQLLKNDSLRLVGCCNELNAGYAADGYARASPARVAVVVVTFMVGSLSVLNAIAGALTDGLSVIVICGCPATKLLKDDRLIHHGLSTTDYDQALRMFREVTASAVRLDNAANAREVLDRTIAESLTKSMPVYIEVPADVGTVPVGRPSPLVINEPAPSKADAIAAVSNAFSRSWNHAAQPVMIIGPLARGCPQPLLLDFIERLGCPVFCQPDGKSLIPEDHDQFFGTFWGFASDPGIEKLALESDLWVVVGGRWSDLHHWGKAVYGPESIRTVDVQDGYVGMPSGERIEGVSLRATLSGIIGASLTSNCETCRPVKPLSANVTDTTTPDPNIPLPMTTISQGIGHLLKGNDTLIADSGDSWFNAQRVRLPRGADYQVQMIYSSIGWSLPATLGIQLARPDGRAILMIGDGAFQMTAQELSTMIRAKANPIILVMNNLGYVIETAIHDGPYNYISNWDYAGLGNCFSKAWHAVDGGSRFASAEESASRLAPGIISLRVKTAGEWHKALERIEREPEKLAILECCVHPTDYSEGLRQLGPVFR
ncbi:pyruvate decarboxylase [Aspergillus heteromorphus CBS 117.55]|uniref:Pyruvate decarboxylase n=1 Tax=Aspergillus heteromorphus CBS 117.55 TaxID=1448321 RepID=A0A317WM32_9EURO|nr:pyruvate decarboxylase [Aspergillus heteromorphus CBS 117.55]PWY87409.1 pyruvate decarboxylase [Aspergillus heteromorphus CBS 117.55]